MTQHTRRRTCRAEILEAIRALESRTQRNYFSPMEIIREMEHRGTSYLESTIRTHITARMCRDAPTNHQPKYDDLERVDRGLYRRVQS